MHESEIERDVFRQCERKLKLWAKDAVQLHEIAEVEQSCAIRNIVWLLVSLAVHLSIASKLPKMMLLKLVLVMWKEESEHVRNQSTVPE